VIEEESEEIEKLINQQGKDPHKSVSSDKSSSSESSRELSPQPAEPANVKTPVAPPRKSPRTQAKVRRAAIAKSVKAQMIILASKYNC